MLTNTPTLHQQRSGFSLLEMLAVLMVMGLIFGVMSAQSLRAVTPDATWATQTWMQQDQRCRLAARQDGHSHVHIHANYLQIDEQKIPLPTGWRFTNADGDRLALITYDRRGSSADYHLVHRTCTLTVHGLTGVPVLTNENDDVP